MPGHVKKRKHASGREVFRARYPDRSRVASRRSASRSSPNARLRTGWPSRPPPSATARTPIRERASSASAMCRGVAGTWINLQPKTRTGYDASCARTSCRTSATREWRT